ncbi:hypothetical protein [Arenimonas terrae]|uniref:Uncharacterized protein n=1 Tax=Arenimonas terrae TaxID=2546226 RepID=A0A5C4RYQ9_9GAMM|nr:hypothetical protein [Arenimonas terrae]TNJ35791.1 hypothetical protein E1B00_08615 [Arenimonas terrae]
MKHDISISLSQDEAIVLSELFGRFERTDVLSLAHNAEFLALQRVAAQLDKTLLEPFEASYADVVRLARERLAAGFEGRAPGVTGDEA